LPGWASAFIWLGVRLFPQSLRRFRSPSLLLVRTLFRLLVWRVPFWNPFLARRVSFRNPFLARPVSCRNQCLVLLNLFWVRLCCLGTWSCQLLTWRPPFRPRLTGYQRVLPYPLRPFPCIYPLSVLLPFRGSLGAPEKRRQIGGPDLSPLALLAEMFPESPVTPPSFSVSNFFLFSSGAAPLEVPSATPIPLPSPPSVPSSAAVPRIPDAVRELQRSSVSAHQPPSTILKSGSSFVRQAGGPVEPSPSSRRQRREVSSTFRYDPPSQTPRLSRPPSEEPLPGPSGFQPPVITTPSRVRFAHSPRVPSLSSHSDSHSEGSVQ
jgi:hypothetical protein